MSRASHRDRILAEGLRLMHQNGFGASSVRDIALAAGAPLGSFSNHFESKERFGLEVLDAYFARIETLVAATLDDRDACPRERVLRYVRACIVRTSESDVVNGCLLGNLSAEMAVGNVEFRRRLAEIFSFLKTRIGECIAAARASGAVSADVDIESTASAIVSGLQGAFLLARVDQNDAPLHAFERQVDEAILQQAQSRKRIRIKRSAR